MNPTHSWAPAITISLLYHAVLLVLVTHNFSATNVGNSREQMITVELMGKTQTLVNKPRHVKSKPVAIAKLTREQVKTELPLVASSVTEESKLIGSIAEQISTDSENTLSGVDIQPLSKLTRTPAFLHKIEPVYPSAEQRAMGQAYVVAEVTIDDKGIVLEVRITKSAGEHFDNAVLEALKKSIFTPGFIDKKAVAVRVLVPFRFNLR